MNILPESFHESQVIPFCHLHRGSKAFVYTREQLPQDLSQINIHSLNATAAVIEFCSSLDLFITLMLMLHDDVVSVNKWITEKIFNGCKTNKRSAKNLFKKSLETFAAHATSFPATHFSPVHGSSLRDKEEIQSVSSKQVLLSAISRSISRRDAENSFFSRR